MPCPPFAIINPTHIKISDNGIDKRLVRVQKSGEADCLDREISDFTRMHTLILKYLKKDLTSTAK
jgi:septin family protein